MKPLLRLPLANSLEPLEGRIAPATIFVGNPNANDTEYSDSPFVNTEGSADPLALQVGGGVPSVADTFFLRLNRGDQVTLFAPGGQTTFLKINSGNVVAFFVDHDLDNEVDPTELTGLALGNAASVQVAGSVFGDVVANLNTSGTLDLTNAAGGLRQSITKLEVLDVTGSIMAGGKIQNINGGAVNTILAGSAINGATFDFFRKDPGMPAAPDVPGGDGMLSFVAAPGQIGAPITNILVKSVGDRIEAGGGGAGANGASLQSIRVTADTDGFLLKAGNGGNGSAGDSRPNGGNGGSLSKIYVSGFSDPTANSANGLRLVAGDAGDAAAGSTGRGGAGGSIKNSFVGFDLRGGRTVVSADLSQDRVSVMAGDGGDGKTAGAGGSIQSTKVRVGTLDGAGVENEIELIGGNGGDAFAGGRAGAGGSVNAVDLRNQNANAFTADIAIMAGHGGVAPADAAGAKGGSVSKATMLGSELAVIGGNGSGGKTGGAGGSLQNLVAVPSEGIITRAISFQSGRGGDGAAGNGGHGGSVKTARVDSGDFILFNVTAGIGGTSATTVGGNGGSISGITALEVAPGGFEGPLTLQAGNAGSGGSKGGGGGSLTDIVLSGNNYTVLAAAGQGGSATVAGNGGNGGSVNRTQISSLGSVAGIPVTGTVQAGLGGDGVGANGAGGRGGIVDKLNINVQGDVAVLAGTGGNGAGGAGGAGGSITKTGAFSESGAGTLRAGDAGLAGSRPGAGGSILSQTVLRALTSITLRAGDGFNGGAGGSVRDVTFASAASGFFPSPSGAVLVQAGAGSGEGTFAGAGGSLTNVVGFASSGGVSTIFQAGNGGGDTKGAAGGSIKDLQIVGGGAVGGVITIAAGDAGDGTTAPTGAAGGSVQNVIVTNLASGSILRSIAAGDGGNAITRGGAGGSVQGVTVLNADIGDRSGPAYGYAAMGGIFAGLGGTAATAGSNGNVIDVRANGIAAIVAGRGAAPDLAQRIEKITVGTANQSVDLIRAEENDVVNYDAAGSDPEHGDIVPGRYATSNLVGFISDPARQDATKFAFTNVVGDAGPAMVFEVGDQPIDGLMMAQFINLRSFNFTPEAYFTSADGLIDFNNRLS